MYLHIYIIDLYVIHRMSGFQTYKKIMIFTKSKLQQKLTFYLIICLHKMYYAKVYQDTFKNKNWQFSKSSNGKECS